MTGIELSEPMVEQLHRKRPDLPVIVGDMATSSAPGQLGELFHVGEQHVGFDTFDIVTQRGTSHHYTRSGDAVTYNATNFRYIWPAECDLMAQLAVMILERRVADWKQTPFTADSDSHVSVWRTPG